jgi:hypothetical protein
MDSDLLQLYARIEAQGYLLETLFAMVLQQRPDGVDIAKDVKALMLSMPTQPPKKAKWMDAATSDLLASLTDEAIEKSMDRVIAKVERACAPAG